MPGLRVLAGTSLDSLVPITEYINTNKTFKLSSDRFEGEIVANIKGFTNEHGQSPESEYFQRGDRQGITWSIQVQGRFLKPYSADDILFGNTFDRPLHLPWGSGAALKFMSYIDPTLEHDLASSTKPWALSPLVSTMPHFAHTRTSSRSHSSQSLPHSESTTSIVSSSDGDGNSSECTSLDSPIDDSDSSIPQFPPSQSLKDDTSQLHLAKVSPSPSPSPSSSSSSSASSSSSSLSSLSSSVSHTTASSKGSSVGKEHKSTFSKLKQGTAKRLKAPKKRELLGDDNQLKQKPLKLDNAGQRRSFFSTPENRQSIEFGLNDIITTDFCYGFLEFSPTLSLRLPGGISFDLMKYWDGQPVRFMCCERKRKRNDGEMGHVGHNESGPGALEGMDDPWGRVFWCVAIEPV